MAKLRPGIDILGKSLLFFPHFQGTVSASFRSHFVLRSGRLSAVICCLVCLNHDRSLFLISKITYKYMFPGKLACTWKLLDFCFMKGLLF